MPLHVTAIIISKPEYREEVLHMLQNMQLNARKEEGCIQYDVHQSIEEPDIFIFHEIWESKDALSIHNDQPYIKSFVDSVSNLMAASPKIYLTIPR